MEEPAVEVEDTFFQPSMQADGGVGMSELERDMTAAGERANKLLDMVDTHHQDAFDA